MLPVPDSFWSKIPNVNTMYYFSREDGSLFTKNQTRDISRGILDKINKQMGGTDMIRATENPDVIFMHCLPSFHDFKTTMAAEQMKLGYDIREVTDEVFSGKNSVVFDEAENRLHTIKAVVVATLA